LAQYIVLAEAAYTTPRQFKVNKFFKLDLTNPLLTCLALKTNYISNHSNNIRIKTAIFIA
ncbi:hypothetical protein, partial [Photobacterium phosphoreum]|uniref:hypothetical protein n=1 Tax=Photobacterium phosphoreum TaxID=659 RepID=UPI0039B10A69